MKLQRWQRGNVTALLLVLLVVFVTVLTASLQSISRQSNQTVAQEQEEQAFGLADAGISYTLWLLGQEGQAYTPTGLLGNPPEGATGHEVYNQQSEYMGKFSVEFLQAAAGYLKVRSIGLDAVRTDLCQVIEAELQLAGSGAYQITNWDHQVSPECVDESGCLLYTITKGQSVNGSLSSGDCDDQYVDTVASKADKYTYAGTAGETLHVHVTSSDFSPYLTLRSPSGADLIAHGQAPWWSLVAWAGVDTCSDGGACIATDGGDITLPETGDYEIEVAWNGSGTQSTGAYTLSLPTACSDGDDNDGDGAVDYPNDFSCSNAADDDEGGPVAQCQDGADNDGDGNPDHPADTGCSSPQDNSESGSAQCDDGLDNDGDSLVDMLDPGCDSTSDTNEEDDPQPQCGDGDDNDGDGAIDYPDDFACSSATDDDEGDVLAACQDNSDNDGDGQPDYPNDPGCLSRQDTSEYGTAQCDDGLDNDGDGAVDYPDDLSCTNLTDTDEVNPQTACQDGLDNDGDGVFDYPNDPGCASEQDSSEYGTTQCDDGLDNDGDTRVDMEDPHCGSPTDNQEANVGPPACSDTEDNDYDLRTDYGQQWYNDNDCTHINHPSEAGNGAAFCDVQSINYNQTRQGQLTTNDCQPSSGLPSGEYADLWEFSGTAGDKIKVELIPDGMAQGYLFLKGVSGQDIDESSYCNEMPMTMGKACIPATLTYTLPATGTYTVIATSGMPGMLFTYSIRVNKY